MLDNKNYITGWYDLINFVIYNKSDFSCRYYEDGYIYHVNKCYNEEDNTRSYLSIDIDGSDDCEYAFELQVVNEREIKNVEMKDNIIFDYELEDNYYLYISDYENHKYKYKLDNLTVDCFKACDLVDFITNNKIEVEDINLKSLSNNLYNKLQQYTNTNKIFDVDYGLIDLINLLLTDEHDLLLNTELHDESYTIVKEHKRENDNVSGFISVVTDDDDSKLFISRENNDLKIKITDSKSDKHDFRSVYMHYDISSLLENNRLMDFDFYRNNCYVEFESNTTFEGFALTNNIVDTENEKIKSYRIRNTIQDIVNGKTSDMKTYDKCLRNIVLRNKSVGLDDETIEKTHGLSREGFNVFFDTSLSFICNELKNTIKEKDEIDSIKVNTKK